MLRNCISCQEVSFAGGRSDTMVSVSLCVVPAANTPELCPALVAAGALPCTGLCLSVLAQLPVLGHVQLPPQRKSCPWPPEQCFTSLPPCQESTESGITGTRIFSLWLTLLVWWMFVLLGKEQVYLSGMKFDQQQGCLQIGPKGFLRFWPLGQMPNPLPSLLRWPVYLGMILVRGYLCESCP